MGSEVQHSVNDVPQNYIPCQMGSIFTETLLCSVPHLLFAGAFVLPRPCEEFPVFMLASDISGKLYRHCTCSLCVCVLISALGAAHRPCLSVLF